MYTEFIAATLEAHGNVEEERIAEAFDRLDNDDTVSIYLYIERVTDQEKK